MVVSLRPGDDGRCAWCRAELEPTPRARRTCGKVCRQALWRFRRELHTVAAADRPLRLAYADPPYPGKSAYYRGHPDYAGEVDHAALVSRLEEFDGWALSTSAAALPAVLSCCAGDDVRIAAWFRGGRPGKSRAPRDSWEPVVFAGARRVVGTWPENALVHRSRPRLTDPLRVIGAKPAAFAYWLFDLLGARRGDSLEDLYPGSGGIGRAWSLSTRVTGTGA